MTFQARQPEHRTTARHRCGLAARWGVALGVLAAAATAFGAPPVDKDLGIPDAPTPVEKQGTEVTEKLGQKIPLGLKFTAPDGTLVPVGQWFNDGKPVVVLMVYFRCPLMCPQTIGALMKAVSGVDWTIGEKYNVVLVSFDPTEGAPQARKQQDDALALYDREVTKGIRAGFGVLTDSQGNASKLADALGFKYKYMPAGDSYSHMGVTFVLTPDGTISRYLYSLNYAPATLRTALLEASQGQIGSALDRATLWCMAYDPVTGKYKIMAKRIMQIGGAASVAVVGAVLVGMLVVERRRKRLAVVSGQLSVSTTAALDAPAQQLKTDNRQLKTLRGNTI